MGIIITPQTNLTQFVEQAVAEIKAKDLEISETGFGRWSPSKVKLLISCPLQFLLNYILRVDYQIPVDPSLEENESMFLAPVGTTAHAIVEGMVLGKSFDQAYAEAREAYIHEVTEHHWHLVDDLSENIKNFFFRLDRFSETNPIVRMDPERKYAVDRNWNPVAEGDRNAYFSGIIDLSVYLENLDGLVIDHKRGGSAKYGISSHRFQTTTYCVLKAAHNPELRGITPMIHFMAEGEVASGEYASRDKILNEYTRSIDSTVHGAVETVQNLKEFKHKTGSACNYCDFKELCRGGKRGTANHLQPIVEASRVFFKC